MSDNQKNENEVKYYSQPHSKAGFVQSIRLNETKNGPYWSIKFNAQIGNSNENEFAFHSLNMVGQQSREFMDQYGQKISDVLQANREAKEKDKNAKSKGIYLALNMSDDQARAFESNGKVVPFIYGRCTSVKYFSIGGKEVFKRSNNATTGEKTKDGYQKPTKVTKTEVAEKTPVNTTSYIDPKTGEMFKEVILSKDEAGFDTKKQALKDAGYLWNNDKKAWCLPNE